jgi:hypothetical protein
LLQIDRSNCLLRRICKQRAKSVIPAQIGK